MRLVLIGLVAGFFSALFGVGGGIVMVPLLILVSRFLARSAMATSLASIITMMEVTGIAHKLISQTFRAVEIFICAGAIYLILNFLVTRAIMALEWWLSPHLRGAPEPRARLEPAHV